MKISFANLEYQYDLYRDEINKAILDILDKSSYIMGDEVDILENSLEKFTNSKYAIACSSGTDALLLALMALGIQSNDEVITTPFSFISTASSIALLKAKPIFVDIDEKTYNMDTTKIEEKITNKTKAIIAVSLYGQPCKIDYLKKLQNKYPRIKIIIDGAQSFGSTYGGVMDSSLGDISITSFFPSKPLGCFGDGGAIFTNDEKLATKIKSLRVHGQNKRYHHQYIGLNGRMDTLQCAVVNTKLKYYEKDLNLRRKVAQKYSQSLQNKNAILPFVEENIQSSWAQYSIRVKNRDSLQKKLKEKNIPTSIHYPLPLHLQECFKYLGYRKGDFSVSEKISNEIISLPMNPYLRDDEIEYIASYLV